jgi:hypothetical protein
LKKINQDRPEMASTSDMNPWHSESYEKVRVLHEKIAWRLKGRNDYADYQDCEDSASQALVAIVDKFSGIEPIVTGKNPETGESIFGFAVKVAQRALWKIIRKQKTHATALVSEASEFNELEASGDITEVRSKRELIIRCIGMLPPFEQKLAGVVAKSPEASERDLALEMTALAGRKVTRYRIRQGMETIRSVFLKHSKSNDGSPNGNITENEES